MVGTYLPGPPSKNRRHGVATMIPATAIDRICVRQRSCQLAVVKGPRIERHRPDGGVNISRANIITIGVSVLAYSNVGIRVFESWCSSIRVFDYPGAGIWESRKPTTGLCYHRVRHLRSGWSTVLSSHTGRRQCSCRENAARKVPLLPVLEKKGEHFNCGRSYLAQGKRSRPHPVLASRPPEQSGKQKAAPSAQPEWRGRNIQDLNQLKPQPIALRRDRCGLISRLKLLPGPK
jgi:hypothetical protein